MNQEWQIRYDVMRKSGASEWTSACAYAGELGFATKEEAEDIKAALEVAQEGTDARHAYEVWPIAAHRDYGDGDMEEVAPARVLVAGNN